MALRLPVFCGAGTVVPFWFNAKEILDIRPCYFFLITTDTSIAWKETEIRSSLRKIYRALSFGSLSKDALDSLRV